MLLVSGLRRRPVSSRFSLTIHERDETRYVSRRGLEDKFTECREMNAGWDAKAKLLWILVGPDVCAQIADRSFAFTLLLSGEKVTGLHLPSALFEAGPPDAEPPPRSLEKGVPAEAPVPPHGAPVLVAETAVRVQPAKALPPPPPPPPEVDVASLPDAHRPPPLAPVVVGVVAVLGAAMGVAYLLTSGPSTPPKPPSALSANPPADSRGATKMEAAAQTDAKPVMKAEAKPAATAPGPEAKAPEAKPVETASAKPVEAAAVKPVETASAKPVEPAAVKPVETASAKPVEAASAKPVEAAAVKPTETASAKPVETASAKPVEAVAAKPVEAVAAKPAEAAAAKPVEPQAPNPVMARTRPAADEPHAVLLASAGDPPVVPQTAEAAARAPAGCGDVAAPTTLVSLPAAAPPPEAFCIARAWSEAGRLDDALAAYAALQQAGYVPAILELAKLYDPLSHRADLSPVPDYARSEYLKVIQQSADDTIRLEAKRRLDALGSN